MNDFDFETYTLEAPFTEHLKKKDSLSNFISLSNFFF